MLIKNIPAVHFRYRVKTSGARLTVLAIALSQSYLQPANEIHSRITTIVMFPPFFSARAAAGGGGQKLEKILGSLSTFS